MIDINVTPAKSTLWVKPEGVVWQKIVVKNNNDTTLTIKPDVYPFYSADSNGNIKLADSLLVYDPYSDLNRLSLTYPLISWGKEVILNAFEERTFIFKYTAGSDASAEKYFFVAFEVINEAANTKGVTPAIVTGTPLLISQAESSEARDQNTIIKDFKVNSVSDSLFPIQAKGVMENQGSNYYTALGYWEVVPIVGTPKKYPIKEDTILAKGNRKVSQQLYPVLPIGVYKVRLVLEKTPGIIMYKREKVVVVLPIILTLAIGALGWIFRSIVNRQSPSKNPPSQKTTQSKKSDNS